MKGKSKYIVPLVLAGVTASAGVVTTINQQQQTMIQAQTENTEISNINGAEIQMKGGFEDIYQLGDEITMPEVSVAENVGALDADKYAVVYKIYRGSKEVAKITDPSEPFVPTYTGAYNVVIEATKDNTVVSKLTGLTIMVEKADAVINLPVNSEYVIPAQLPVSNEKGLTIPAPTVTITENDEEVEKTASEAGLIVKLVTPSDDEPITLTLDQSGKFYKVSKSQLATAGTYQIRYEYRDSNDVLISKLETNFQVVNNLKAPTSLHLKLSGSVPATGNVNKEISIPKVTVLDSQNSTDGINAHVTVKVIRIEQVNGVLTEVSSSEINYEDYTFTPTEEGNYIVSYQADLNSIYNNVVSTLYKPSTIIKISDKANPIVMPTYSYTVVDGVITSADKDNDGNADATFDADDESAPKVEDVLVNRKVDVPSIAVRGSDGKARFKLPAIYGTDNKTAYGNMTFSREIVGNNIAKITVEADPNEVSEEIVLNQTGNYEIRYIATDEAGNKVRATYSLVVKDADDVKDGKTNVNLNINVKTVSDKDILRFSAPTATDTYDNYLDVEVGYKVLDEDGTVKKSEVLTETNSNGKYEIKIADIIEEFKNDAKKPVKLVVYTTATADSTLADTREAFKTSGDTVTRVEKEIAIIDSTSDTATAVLTLNDVKVDATNWNAALLELNADKIIEKIEKTYDQDGNLETYDAKIGVDGYAYTKADAQIKTDGGKQLAAFDQGNGSITLPELTFTDSDENLRLTLTIEDRFGNAVTKNTYEVIEKIDNQDGTWSYNISSCSFKLSASGVYKVTYRAEDTAGNVTVKSFGIRVNDKTAPTIVIDDEDKFGVDVQVGEFFEVPVGNLYKDGQPEDGSVTWQLTCSAGAVAQTSSTGFTPLTEGTYYITYYGVDENDNEQILKDNGLFYVNAVDTTDPVFNDDSSFTLNPTMAWDDEKTEMEVKIPVVYATDPIRNESLDVVYSVTSPKGSKIDIKDYDDQDDVRYFVAKDQGVYTVTYTATDSANNTITMTKEISIGDCEAPEITWKNDSDIPTTLKLGETWTLPLSNMTLTDKVTTDQEFLNDNMKITLVKPDGTTSVTNEGTTGKNYIWTFSETGSYTLRIVVEDEAGQSRTYKYTINVDAEDAENDVVNSVVGTVLIVISVVILAGVVIYFVVSSRKKSPAKRSPKTKKKD